MSIAPKVPHKNHSLELELRKLRMWPEPYESPWVFFSLHRGYPAQDDPGPDTGREGRGPFAPSPSWLTPSSRRWLNSAHAKGASSTTLISPLVSLSILMHIPPWQLQSRPFLSPMYEIYIRCLTIPVAVEPLEQKVGPAWTWLHTVSSPPPLMG